MKILKWDSIDGRSYHKFSWPKNKDMPGFVRYDLIYGWNGSGKTTLADILQKIGKRQPVSFEEDGIRDFTITTDGKKKITARNIATDSDLPSIRVFNRSFVEKNVFSTKEEGMVAPIFFIGEKNIEKQNELENLKNDHEALTDKLNSTSKELKENRQDKNSISQAKRIKDQLEIPNYTKASFQKDCDDIIAAGNMQQYKKTPDARSALMKLIHSENKENIPIVSLELPDISALTSEVKTLLQKTVVSQTIAALTEDAETAEWVKKGLQLHKDHTSEICKFCEQKLPAERLTALEGHFNDQFNKLASSLASKIKDIDQKTTALKNFTSPVAEQFHVNLKDQYSKSIAELKGQISACIDFLNQLIEALENKKKSLFAAMEFNVPLVNHGETKLGAVNAVINEHNRITNDFNTVKEKAKQDYRYALIADVIEEYKQLKSEIDSLKNKRENLEKEIKRHETEINGLERKIIDHKKPAEALNRDLKDYLGHHEIRFVTDDSNPGYTIMRGDQSAEDLSEGEKTAIALLYFLQSLQDKDFVDMASGVVVLDDPVSSLDELSLFQAFSYIKERTKKAGQLFVLTHNFSLFREVRRWLRKEKAAFFQTVCLLEGDTRSSRITKLVPLLKTMIQIITICFI